MTNLPQAMPPQPELQAFALLLETPSVVVGSDPAGVAWNGRGPFDVPLKVRGDGLVIFNFEETEHFASPAIPGWQPVYGEKMPAAIAKAESHRSLTAYARLEYMNAWMAAYGSGMAAVQAHMIICQPPLDPHRHLKAVRIGGAWHAFADRQSRVTGQTGGSTIGTGVLDHAVAVMSAAQARLGDRFATTLALLHQASHQYVRHQFASAHLLGWTLTEQILHARWREYREQASTGPTPVTAMNRDRKEQLDGRDFTASVISQILSLAGRIDDDRLASLDSARKARNNFAHALKPIGDDQARKALTTAAEMLTELLGTRIAAQLSTTSWI